MKGNIKIELLPNQFLNNNGTFNKKSALNLCGKIAGVCYDKEGFNHLKDEQEEKTNRRIDMTLNNGHHSVYDHIFLNLNIHNIPKILAMVLNNEKEYTTSEKSARYTKIIRNDNSVITEDEEYLYNKWCTIFEKEIKKQYKGIFPDNKIKKLAQENARYLVTVFMPTEMIYTTSLRQINYIASWMLDYALSYSDTHFKAKLSKYMKNFIEELYSLNILVPKLMRNEKYRKLSLFGENLEKSEEYFGNVYNTTYKASFAYLAQAHRHRTIDYQMEITKDKKFFIPPILLENKTLVDEWLNDINKISDKDIISQGRLILINECGKYEDFILKCKERLCTCAQLEIMLKTKEILEKYKNELENSNNALKDDITKYSRGARCTFPDFDCKSDCKFNEGKILIRKI